MPETPTELVRLKKEFLDKIRQLAEAGYRPLGAQFELIYDEWLELKAKEAEQQKAEA